MAHRHRLESVLRRGATQAGSASKMTEVSPTISPRSLIKELDKETTGARGRSPRRNRAEARTHDSSMHERQCGKAPGAEMCGGVVAEGFPL
jgi:hypothetical protein